MSVLAQAAARKLCKYYGISSPLDIDVEAIALGENAYVNEKPMSGAEGRIIHQKKHAIITINSNIKYLPKKRFVIAHELGHFKLHKELFFNCDNDAFIQWHSKGSQEVEANIFAAELLMPEVLFQDFSRGKMISLDLLSKLSNQFETSLTATAFRYAEIGNHPTAIVFCKDGEVKWSKINDDFQYKYIPHGMKVSTSSYTYDFFKGAEIPKDTEEVPLDTWFLNDYNFKLNHSIYEQCHLLPEYNAVLVILWEN